MADGGGDLHEAEREGEGEGEGDLAEADTAHVRRVARWTEQWLDAFAGRGLDAPLDGPDALLLPDATERLIQRPSSFRALGGVRHELLRRRQFVAEQLADLDADLARLVERRRGLLARIHACNVALAGTGVLGPAPGDPRRVRLRQHRVERVADPLPPVAPVDRPGGADPCGATSSGGRPSGERPSGDRPSGETASGQRLRVAAEALLRATGCELALPELERLLRLDGIAVAGRASQTLANALRPAIADGSVVRVSRGRYRAA